MLPPAGAAAAPFGFLEPFESAGDPAYFAASGAGAVREGRMVWEAAEISPGVYDWAQLPADATVSSAAALGADILLTVGMTKASDKAKCYAFPDPCADLKTECTPCDTADYLTFFSSTVLHYRDSVKYWQIGNEQNHSWAQAPQAYADFVKINRDRLEELCPDCELVLGGVSSRPSGYADFYEAVLARAAGIKAVTGVSIFDVFDFHWAGYYGSYLELRDISDGQFYGFRDYVSAIKTDMAAGGLGDRVWITEMSTYSGDPADGAAVNPPQTERQQAAELLKRHVYALSSGIERIFWVKLTEWYNFAQTPNGFYDNTGLVNNPAADGDSSPKLAYYAYRKLAEKLQGAGRDNIQTVGEADGVYAYRLSLSSPVWVVWNDGAAPVNVPLSGFDTTGALLTEAVPGFEAGAAAADYSSAFSTRTLAVSAGGVSVPVSSHSPVFVELYLDVSSPTAPGSPEAQAVSTAQSNLSWTASTDDVAVAGYRLDVSSDAGFAGYVAGYGDKDVGDVLSAEVSGLEAATTYYARVRAYDAALNLSSYSVTVPAATPPLPPGAPVLSGLALGISSISWTWSAAGGAEGYRLTDAGGADISGALAAGAAAWTETGLAAGAAYVRKVEAFNVSGGSASAPAALYTLAAAPAGSAFSGVYPGSVTVQWDGGPNPAGTKYEAACWTDGGAAAGVTVYWSSAAFAGLISGGNVRISVRAFNGDGIPTAFAAEISTRTPFAAVTARPGAAERIIFLGSSGEAALDIPADAFYEAVQVSAGVPQHCPPPAGGFVPLAPPVCVEILTDKPVQPARSVELSATYSNAAGLDEGRLVLARYDEARAAWVPLATARDAAANRVMARTDHLSVFQVLQSAPAQGLDGVTAGPNVLRPARYPGQVMVFRYLPPGARLRVYTLLGELLRDTREDGSGNAVWDGRNRSGRRVAGGVYLALIEAGGKKRILRVAVER